jgi:hypothetical protein
MLYYENLILRQPSYNLIWTPRLNLNKSLQMYILPNQKFYVTVKYNFILIELNRTPV